MAKKRVGRYPKEFRRVAVERLKNCDNIVALAQELGVHRRLLYKWRDQPHRRAKNALHYVVQRFMWRSLRGGPENASSRADKRHIIWHGGNWGESSQAWGAKFNKRRIALMSGRI